MLFWLRLAMGKATMYWCLYSKCSGAGLKTRALDVTTMTKASVLNGSSYTGSLGLVINRSNLLPPDRNIHRFMSMTGLCRVMLNWFNSYVLFTFNTSLLCVLSTTATFLPAGFLTCWLLALAVKTANKWHALYKKKSILTKTKKCLMLKELYPMLVLV